MVSCSTTTTPVIVPEKNYLLTTERGSRFPIVIGKDKLDEYVGTYLSINGHGENFYSEDLGVLLELLSVKGYLKPGSPELQSNQLLKTVIELMKSHLQTVKHVRAQKSNSDAFFAEFKRFTSEDEDLFFVDRRSTKTHQYTGYIQGGVGRNLCSGKIDTSWGLDSSGLIYLVYRMNNVCFPRVQNRNLSVLLDERDKVSYFYPPEVIRRYFEITDKPVPGDLVVQGEHVSMYVSDGLSIGMGETGIVFELFNKRPLKTETYFVRVKDTRDMSPVCKNGTYCDVCDDVPIDKFKKERYSKQSRMYLLHEGPLMYTVKDNFVYLKDFWGKGSNVKYCEVVR